MPRMRLSRSSPSTRADAWAMASSASATLGTPRCRSSTFVCSSVTFSRASCAAACSSLSVVTGSEPSSALAISAGFRPSAATVAASASRFALGPSRQGCRHRGAAGGSRIPPPPADARRSPARAVLAEDGDRVRPARRDSSTCIRQLATTGSCAKFLLGRGPPAAAGRSLLLSLAPVPQLGLQAWPPGGAFRLLASAGTVIDVAAEVILGVPGDGCTARAEFAGELPERNLKTGLGFAAAGLPGIRLACGDPGLIVRVGEFAQHVWVGGQAESSDPGPRIS